jgi:apolipoprotein N-acyltransferase
MKFNLLAFAAGLAGACGFQPWGLWPLTILAFAILLRLVGEAPRQSSALARGWWFGVGHFALGLNWIATAFTFQAAMPAWLGWLAVVLLSLYLAIYPAVAAGIAWKYGRRDRLALIFWFAGAWIVTEWLRATLFTGFAWNPAGVALIDAGGVAGLAKYVGTYGLSGVVVLAAGALLLLVRKRWWRAAALAVPILAAALLLWPGSAPEPAATQSALRIVQPNIGQQVKWDPGFEAENFRRLALGTGRPGAAPRLIFWPEAAVPDYLSIEPDARRRLAALLGPRDMLLLGGIELVLGADRRPTAVLNSVFALAPDGRLLGRYDKAHLVPYGEYLPLRPLLSAIGISQLAPSSLDQSSGPGPATLDLPGFGSAGIQICYEIIFSGEVVDRTHRPNFIFNPSNDAWFGAWGPPQHLAQARLRALEEGLPVIRSTPTGISALVDAEGRLLASLPLGTAGAIDARLPPQHAPTAFARFGNVLPMVLALLLAAAAIAVGRKPR